MWLFRKNSSSKKLDLLKGFVDWHSHILPGVDDGVQSMGEAYNILDKYEEFGVKQLWLTPHIMEDIPNETDLLRKKFIELKSDYSGKIELHLGSENMLDNLFEQRLEKDDLLPLANKYLLVETSYFNPPVGFSRILDQIKEKDYTPVLAHPERYIYMDKSYYNELKERGIKFQLNITSLWGVYGPEARKKAKWLNDAGYYEFSGTDIHSMKSIGKFFL